MNQSNNPVSRSLKEIVRDRLERIENRLTDIERGKRIDFIKDYEATDKIMKGSKG